MIRASDILADVRENLSDSGASRWSTETLLKRITGAVTDIFDLRPDLLLRANGTLIEPLEVEDVADEIELPPSLRETLALMATSKALAQDSDDRTNLERSVFYQKLGLNRIRGG